MIPFTHGMAVNYKINPTIIVKLALVVIHSCSFFKQHITLSIDRINHYPVDFVVYNKNFFCEFFSLATIKSERTIHYARITSTVRYSPREQRLLLSSFWSKRREKEALP